MFLSDSNKIRGIIVQARVNSTRLPGKVLLDLYEGESVLEFLLRRLSECQTIHKLVVATSLSSCDDVLASWLSKQKIFHFRGEEHDCLKRITDAANAFGIEVIVRVTADCPLVIPEVIDEMMNYYLKNETSLDYLSNRQSTNFPEGVDVEIFTRQMLREACKEAVLTEEREHINYFFLNRPDRYRIRYFSHTHQGDYSRFKLSIDTATDLERIRGLFSEHGLGQSFSFEDLTNALERV